jgi:hypothetical protein
MRELAYLFISLLTCVKWIATKKLLLDIYIATQSNPPTLHLILFVQLTEEKACVSRLEFPIGAWLPKG